jgi:hypothetical protein
MDVGGVLGVVAVGADAFLQGASHPLAERGLGSGCGWMENGSAEMPTITAFDTH